MIKKGETMQTVMDEGRLKQVFKEALAEMIEEKQSLFHDIVVEAIEDIALNLAIREGRGSGKATRQEVFDILEGRS
ncbi:conserved hypothetical protein [Candidatus Desulfarcum epimagneticum]|uniref:Uncharacterized protein n=1 Tax=uncultured Desulfobacteraceae bacterium TaxID=218296 RepID=A0A484HCM8_9BACT|nr:conserved hypothetical protein [uncultured Desulfobacteraceae bacterium]